MVHGLRDTIPSQMRISACNAGSSRTFSRLNHRHIPKGETCMATLNQCSFIGHLGKDPELSVTNEGKPVTKFSLAVDQGKDQQPMWLNITCWDKLAEIVEKYARKGSLVFVQGRLVLRTYR